MKCSFCEQPLICKACRRPYHPRRSETHLGTYQPDTQVACPECQKVLTCAACGFVYGDPEDPETEER
jgi:hypothetical protein